jgi:hypothetical protein
MSANKSASVCAATSSGLLIKIDANRTSQNPTELLKTGSASIIRPPPLAGMIAKIAKE